MAPHAKWVDLTGLPGVLNQWCQSAKPPDRIDGGPPAGVVGQGSGTQHIGLDRRGNRPDVDGSRGVNLDQKGIRQVQRSRYVVHPLLDDLVTLMLGEVTSVPVWIIDAPAVPLRSNVERTSAVDLYDPPIESL